MLTLSCDDYLWFIDEALDEMVRIVTELGDAVASTRPPLPEANSPYAILTHCLGVMEFWGGHMVAGRTVERDRDAEFEASGRVAELASRAAGARRQLERDLADARAQDPPRHPVAPDDADLPLAKSQSAVLIHIARELLQHLGHMELTRDLLQNA